jgi:hypothetical protein
MIRWMQTLGILLLASLAWKFRHVFMALAAPPPPPAKAIVFDNGTVRQMAPAASEVAVQAGPPPLPPGVPRRCTRRQETTYTNVPCPPGYKERPVDTSRVSVVESGRPAAPAQPASPEPPRKTLRDVLDLNADPQLRERMLQRAEGQGR